MFIAQFLYANASKSVDIDENFEEWERWEFENSKIESLIRKMYKADSECEPNITLLQKKRIDFLQKIRISAVDDYNKYQDITGPHFNFLIERKDLIGKLLLLKVLESDSSTMKDKKFAEKVLKKYYH